MTAWTMNAVSVAEPSVWNQLDVARDLAEEEVLDAADEAGALLEPVDGGERDVLDQLTPRRLAAARRRDGHQRLTGRLDRVEQRLDAVDVDAGKDCV